MTNMKSSEFKKMMCEKHSLDYDDCLQKMTNWWYLCWTEPCDNPLISHDGDIMRWLTDEVESLKRNRDFNYGDSNIELGQQLKFKYILKKHALKNIMKNSDMLIHDSECWLEYLDLEENDEERYIEIENNSEIVFKDSIVELLMNKDINFN